MEPLLSALDLGASTDRTLVVIALGIGATTGSYYNDPIFWITHLCSGLSVLEVLYLFVAGTYVRGVVGFILMFVIGLNRWVGFLLVALLCLALVIVIIVLSIRLRNQSSLSPSSPFPATTADSFSDDSSHSIELGDLSFDSHHAIDYDLHSALSSRSEDRFIRSSTSIGAERLSGTLSSTSFSDT